MRIVLFLAFFFSMSCGPRWAGIGHPTVEGVTNIKGASNVELIGFVYGKANAPYQGCKGVAQNAYENLAIAAKKRDANALGEFKWKSGKTESELPTVSSIFLFYYWGCRAQVAAEAYKIPQ
tara:strand:+ start:267 stop:629 length:363 start_codon:yes stop_codon:yes gene_type:complete